MATIRKRESKSGKPRWLAQIRMTVRGSLHSESKTFASKKEAAAWARERETEISGSGFGVSSGGLTIKELLAEYRKLYDTRQRPFGDSKRYAILQLERAPIAKFKVEKVTVDNYISHAQTRAALCSPATVANDFVWLREALVVMGDHFGINTYPEIVEKARRLAKKRGHVGKAKERTRRPSLDELTAMLDHFESAPRSKVPMCRIILFAIFSCRRSGEITDITWEDTDLETRTMWVMMKDPAERKVRMQVALSERCVEILKMTPEGERAGRIFPFNNRSIEARFQRARNILGIEDLRFHDLRHEGVSHLFELGMNVEEVARHSGHRSWATLKRYTHTMRNYDKYESWRWSPDQCNL